MRVVIAGGGIGGLTAALSLHQAGIDVVVHEAVADIKPLGVGINILPHAARELIDLGLETAVDRLAIRTSAMRSSLILASWSSASPVVSMRVTTGPSGPCIAANCTCCCCAPLRSGRGLNAS